MTEKLTNFPKIKCPFVRELVSKNKYLATPEIQEGFEWVFEDEDTIAVEKLDGTNVKVAIENKAIKIIQNRTNVVYSACTPTAFNLSSKQERRIVQAVFNSIDKKWMQDNTIRAGEVIGPKIQGNPYNLKDVIWYPFDKAQAELEYVDFKSIDKSFESIEEWMRNLQSLLKPSVKPEGVILYNLKRIENGEEGLAKLRLDMYDWFYE